MNQDNILVLCQGHVTMISLFCKYGMFLFPLLYSLIPKRIAVLNAPQNGCYLEETLPLVDSYHRECSSIIYLHATKVKANTT